MNRPKVVEVPACKDCAAPTGTPHRAGCPIDSSVTGRRGCYVVTDVWGEAGDLKVGMQLLLDSDDPVWRWTFTVGGYRIGGYTADRVSTVEVRNGYIVAEDFQ